MLQKFKLFLGRENLTRTTMPFRYFKLLIQAFFGLLIKQER
jgi:hypothetical protein